jgi:hypothetical protein
MRGTTGARPFSTATSRRRGFDKAGWVGDRSSRSVCVRVSGRRTWSQGTRIGEIDPNALGCASDPLLARRLATTRARPVLSRIATTGAPRSEQFAAPAARTGDYSSRASEQFEESLGGARHSPECSMRRPALAVRTERHDSAPRMPGHLQAKLEWVVWVVCFRARRRDSAALPLRIRRQGWKRPERDSWASSVDGSTVEEWGPGQGTAESAGSRNRRAGTEERR